MKLIFAFCMAAYFGGCVSAMGLDRKDLPPYDASEHDGSDWVHAENIEDGEDDSVEDDSVEDDSVEDDSLDTYDSSDDHEFCGDGICSETEDFYNCPQDCGMKRIFVTKAVYKGDLKTAGDATSGMEGADNICNVTAAEAGLGGIWKAWLSDLITDAIDRIADVGPWYFIDGFEAVFDNKANLRTIPLMPIYKDENGRSLISATSLVWTGTQLGGIKAEVEGQNSNCNNWTSADMSSMGYSGSYNEQDMRWTDSGMANCSINRAHLYCIQQ